MDCGFGLVMASFWPTMRFSSVDFPAFGLPTTVTIPARGMRGWAWGRRTCNGWTVAAAARDDVRADRNKVGWGANTKPPRHG
ncbi:hypothetical protein rosag_36860 [Roseisolibacter agri]|uniref:Uncharacterized protein n=1 Tax=Roseisolibacter agri TaxID=2014610 RepID=A0AA37QJX4_9BACT|nr:hypothetical protein rosag_36860 [Roseisolibacter agri]